MGPQEIKNVPIDFPCVVKVGNCHAGYGKSLIKSSGDLDDLASIVALNKQFFTYAQYLKFVIRIE